MIELSRYVFEALRKDEEFILYRGRSESVPVAVLLLSPAIEYPAPESLKRLEQTYSLKEELDSGWAARPIQLARYRDRTVLVLEDSGGIPLDQILTPAGRNAETLLHRFAFLLRVGINLAKATGELHQRGIVHRDIKPGNVLVNSETGQVWLTGFGIASRLPRERQAPEPAEFLEGTLAYMAPEQTGRMNRSIDSRSDLYSLGVTLYQTLTGSLPFEASDPMEWVHCHIAKKPSPPSERLETVPAPVSAIIMKLLAKTAEERYQTATGVESDLRRCLDELEGSRPRDPVLRRAGTRALPSDLRSDSQPIAPFRLGEHDTPDRLLIPEKLYGRTSETETLLASFDRVVASGTPELVLVCGYSGIGKSSVVNELHKALVPRRGFFASGKFDQYKRDIPYSTLAQALQSLVRPLLSKSEAELGTWRDAFREALGPNGLLIVDLVPELKLVIGEQPPVPVLPPQDAQRRFQMVFLRFLGAFARPEHPLALFLDDLQWLDTATLDLLEHLVTHSEVRHLLLVGAYRDNEVGPAHPLHRTLEAIRNAGARVHEIVLAPLGLKDVGRLVADALHCKPNRSRPVAQLVHEKTGGNPFFAIQFFTALAEEGLLTFDPVATAWQWDINRIRAKTYTDNVVDLMAGKLRRFSATTQEAVQQLACLGNIADVATLAIILETPEHQVEARLWEAVRQELVVPLKPLTTTLLLGTKSSNTPSLPARNLSAAVDGDGHAPRSPASSTSAKTTVATETVASSGGSVSGALVSRSVPLVYKFLHDRIQQAAYTLIPEEQRAEIHLRIGRLLLASMTTEGLAEHPFDVANQLNRGAARLVERNEKTQVAAINLRAGQKAKASAAFASACVYLTAGMALLDERDWAGQYELLFRLWLERAECEFLTGNFDTAEQLIGELLQRGASKVDQAAAYRLKVLLHTVKSESAQAIDTGLTCLRLFSIDLPAHPSWELVQAEYEKVWQTLNGRPIESLIDLPLITDPELQAAMQVLSVLQAPAHITEFHLMCLLVCRMVNISMQDGTSGASAHGYALLGYILGPVFHHYSEGYRFAKLACNLVEKHGFIAYQAKAYHAMATVALWTQPIGTAIDLMRATFRSAIETGDLPYACYSMALSVTALLLRNDLLDAVWRESERGLDFIRKTKFRDVADIIVSQQRFIATMQGRTATFSTFSDAQFDESTFEAQLTGERMTLMICFYWTVKLKTRFLSRDYPEALAAANKAKALLWSSTTEVQLLDYFYYTALTVAALYEKASADEQVGWQNLLAVHREQLREWAENYPATFADKHALVSAEIARLEGRGSDAMRLYREAIRLARENGFVQNEALAYELAAGFYAAREFEDFAHLYLLKARYCYLRWGADGKVRQLDELYPGLDEKEPGPGLVGTIGASLEHLDLATVLKVSEAISGEILLEKLINKLMQIALEQAGAVRGLLILARGNEYRIEAEALLRQGFEGQALLGQGLRQAQSSRSGSDRERITVDFRQSLVTSSDLPESLLRYVIRTQESVTLRDASAENLFSEDEYIQRKRPRSVFCLPLIKQGKLVGVLYLENNLAPGVFTSKQLAILVLIASEAAIALEQARLYADLSQENSERRKAEEAVRASEERWRTLFENSSAGIALITADGRCFAANFAFQKMLGYTEQELQRLTTLDLTLEQDRAADEALRAEAVAGQWRHYRVERRFRRKDGSVIWTDVSAVSVPAAKSDSGFFAAVIVDISERKQAEEMQIALAHEREMLMRQRAADLANANEALRSCLDALASVPQLDAFIGQVMVAITRQLGAVSSNLRLLDVDQKGMRMELLFQDDSLLSPDDAHYAERFQSFSLEEMGSALIEPYNVLNLASQQALDMPADLRAYLQGLGVRVLLRIPLLSQGRLNGLLSFRFAEERDFQVEELEIARALATQASLAIHLTELATSAKQSAVLEERTRLAGEIHDSLAQSFTGITMQLEMAKELKIDKDDEVFNYVDRANDLARFGLAEARRSVLSLQSMTAKDSGLIESLQILAERSNIAGRLRCTFRSNLRDDESVPIEIRQDLLRIAQEAISNALRHAKSTSISVTLRFDPPNLILKVKDNGVGMTTKAETREGFGFVNMRARVKKLNGILAVRTAPGRGTSISVRVPFKQDRREGAGMEER